MLGNFVKRLLNAAVLGLAALTFFLVPLGRKTAFQHVVAVLGSAPAREAGASIAAAARRAGASVRTEVERLFAAKPPANEPAPAEPEPPSRPEAHR